MLYSFYECGCYIRREGEKVKAVIECANHRLRLERYGRDRSNLSLLAEDIEDLQLIDKVRDMDYADAC